MSGPDDVGKLRALTDQADASNREVTRMVVGYYQKLLEAGAPIGLAETLTGDYHKAMLDNCIFRKPTP